MEQTFASNFDELPGDCDHKFGGLPPHQVMFARPFRFAIDYHLATPEALASSPQVYITEIKPKLDILSHLAMENSRESADKQRFRVNEGLNFPPFRSVTKFYFLTQ